MPGLDGTGPRGMGPMTGGARGWYNPASPLLGGGAPYVAPRPWAGYGPYDLPSAYGYGMGMGRGFLGRGIGSGGRGRGRGMGRGMGRRW